MIATGSIPGDGIGEGFPRPLVLHMKRPAREPGGPSLSRWARPGVAAHPSTAWARHDGVAA